MKEFSEEFISVLRRANSDDEFAEALLNDTDGALRIYELKPEEVEYLKSYNSKAKIQSDYRVIWNKNPYTVLFRLFSPAGAERYSAIRLILSAIIVFGTLAYYIANLFFPSFLAFIGILLWTEIDPFVRSIIAVYGGVFFFFSLLYLFRTLSGLTTPTRIVLLITAVILVIIPVAISLSYLPASAQSIIVRVGLVLAFTALPASFYSLFIAGKGKALWEEFMHNLTRLDPVGYRNMTEIYRRKFEALYGPVDQIALQSALLSNETPFPVFLATFIIGLGWVLFFFLSSNGGDFFTGVISPFTFGFLGAYVFTLHMLFRRYVQSDLKSTAYVHACQRILTTWVWAYVLSILPWQTAGLDENTSNQLVSVLAFTVGIFPDIAWQVIGQFVKMLLGFILPSFKQEYPLNKINGVTVWVEARLLEEDIENVQNLVTTNVIDLVLRTNLQPRRIIDWIDQGILRLHLGQDENSELWIKLKKRGIITATDLISSHETFSQASNGQHEFFLGADLDQALDSIKATIENAPNMYHVKAWRGAYLEFNEKLPNAVKKQVTNETQIVFDKEEKLAPVLTTSVTTSDTTVAKITSSKTPPNKTN